MGREALPQGRGPACQPGLGEISNMDDTRAMDPDDRRPADEPAADEPTADEPAGDEPAAWDRHEMETDDAGELQERDVEPLNPKWNKGQMAEEREDGTRSPLATDTALTQPPGGLSGARPTPGGGERWAERDREGDRG